MSLIYISFVQLDKIQLPKPRLLLKTVLETGDWKGEKKPNIIDQSLTSNVLFCPLSPSGVIQLISNSCRAQRSSSWVHLTPIISLENVDKRKTSRFSFGLIFSWTVIKVWIMYTKDCLTVIHGKKSILRHAISSVCTHIHKLNTHCFPLSQNT